MKTNSFLILSILALALSCNKSSDPKTTTGCNFTFKGKSYSIAAAGCDKGQISAFNGTWLISIDPSNGIVGFDDGTTSSTYVATTTVSKNGNTVSFNTTLKNDDGESGSINGTCTCSVGKL